MPKGVGSGYPVPQMRVLDLAASLGVERRSLMDSKTSRRTFLGTGLAAGSAALAGIALHPLLLAQTPPAAPAASPATSKAPDRGPRLEPDLVESFVRAAHGNLERTKELLARQPALVNATWDWGGGDWETGLGGASHMGNPEIARFLLANGARMDIFCAAMMGKTAIVEAFLKDDPAIVNLRGPHGIPLLRHAVAGGQTAIADLLKSHGAS